MLVAKQLLVPIDFNMKEEENVYKSMGTRNSSKCVECVWKYFLNIESVNLNIHAS